MADTINGIDLLGSGGHEWLWREIPVAEKVLSTVGTKGAYSFAVSAGPRPGMIVGELRGSGANVAASHVALNAIEATIELLGLRRTPVSYADAQGRTGTSLVVGRYRRQGPRGIAADGKAVWQRYALEIRDNAAGW